MRYLRIVAFASALLVVTSGCQLFRAAQRYANAPASVTEPFWCDPAVGTALSPAACKHLSAQLDLPLLFAYRHFDASDATGAGATSSPYATGVGAAFRFSGPRSEFNVARPDTLLYDGVSANAQVAGLEWNVSSASAPDGFLGPNDVWDNRGDGVWRLRVWLLRPFQNEPNVFADSHPCLAAGGPVYDITAACYTTTHINQTEILVSNDDGYNAPGIDTAVRALLTLPNVHLTVSAPATERSGTGGSTSPPPHTATSLSTLSGFPVEAVDGFPADSVQYALDQLHANPDLLVAGINNGQNTGPLINLSGTVGAARVGGRHEIPAVAVSQGLGSPPNYARGALAMLAWVYDFLLGRVGPPRFETVTSINIPTCPSGSVRGTRVLPTALDFSSGPPLSAPNCNSTKTEFVDDIDGFLNGFITVSSIGT